MKRRVYKNDAFRHCVYITQLLAVSGECGDQCIAVDRSWTAHSYVTKHARHLRESPSPRDAPAVVQDKTGAGGAGGLEVFEEHDDVDDRRVITDVTSNINLREV